MSITTADVRLTPTALHSLSWAHQFPLQVIIMDTKATHPQDLGPYTAMILRPRPPGWNNVGRMYQNKAYRHTMEAQYASETEHFQQSFYKLYVVLLSQIHLLSWQP